MLYSCMYQFVCGYAYFDFIDELTHDVSAQAVAIVYLPGSIQAHAF